MARCDCCETLILFGGVKKKGMTFCSDDCYQQVVLAQVADQIPHDVVAKYIKKTHRGPCPKCGGEGPNDVQFYYLVKSYIYLTTWQTKHQIGCHRCGIKSKLYGLFVSFIAGWWSAIGLFVTPVQIFRNIKAMGAKIHSKRPTPMLETLVRIDLAAQMVEKKKKKKRRRPPAGF